MTVLGPIDGAQLGVTLMHEHLLIDVSYKWQPPVEVTLRALAEQPISLANLGHLRRNIGAVKANFRLDDVDVAAAEALAFKREGGATIVDVSPPGIGRDPRGLRAIAAQSGVQVVTCTGFYLARSHPAHVAPASVEALADEMIGEIREGIGDTGIRPGIIGEIGLGEPMYAAGHTGDEMHPDEEKVLRAAGRAQRATGLPITVHIYNYRPNRLAHLALDVLEAEGVALDRVVIGHLDVRIDVDYAASVAERGAYAEFDTFGIEAYLDSTLSEYPRDTERVTALVELVARGYLERLLISHDVCTKMQLAAFGGWGYAHISRHIEPRLRKAGLSERGNRHDPHRQSAPTARRVLRGRNEESASMIEQSGLSDEEITELEAQIPHMLGGLRPDEELRRGPVHPGSGRGHLRLRRARAAVHRHAGRHCLGERRPPQSGRPRGDGEPDGQDDVRLAQQLGQLGVAAPGQVAADARAVEHQDRQVLLRRLGSQRRHAEGGSAILVSVRRAAEAEDRRPLRRGRGRDPGVPRGWRTAGQVWPHAARLRTGPPGQRGRRLQRLPPARRAVRPDLRAGARRHDSSRGTAHRGRRHWRADRAADLAADRLLALGARGVRSLRRAPAVRRDRDWPGPTGRVVGRRPRRRLPGHDGHRQGHERRLCTVVGAAAQRARRRLVLGR